MAKVILVTDGRIIAIRPTLEDATPIVPMRSVLLQFAVETTDEWEIPAAPLSLALHPKLAQEIAEALLEVCSQLE